MQRSTAKRRVATAAPIPAIVLKTGNGGDSRSRLGFALVTFMRVMAALWIVRGLLQWSTVLMSSSNGGSLFSDLAAPAMVAAVFFAVVDFVASIGLWLAAPWGGVIWLVAVGAQLPGPRRDAGLFRLSPCDGTDRYRAYRRLSPARLARRAGGGDSELIVNRRSSKISPSPCQSFRGCIWRNGDPSNLIESDRLW